MKADTFDCRWCDRTSTRAQGIAAHERNAHPKEWKKDKKRPVQTALAATAEAPAPERVVIPPPPEESVRVITEEPKISTVKFNTASEVEVLIRRIDGELEVCDGKIQELRAYERLHEQYTKEREILARNLEEMRSQPEGSGAATFHNPSDRRHDVGGSAS